MLKISRLQKEITRAARSEPVKAFRLFAINYWALAFLAIVSVLAIQSEWKSAAELDRLSSQNARLELENSNYRALSGEIGITIQSLNSQISKLSERIEAVPMKVLPMEYRAPSLGDSSLDWEDFRGSVENFNELFRLLSSLETRIDVIKKGVAYREALASATPSIWPADGWISGTYGYRKDPFTGEQDFHPAIDISSQRGQPVYATATGRVVSAKRNGNYGNLVEIDHGFELSTRYGHLSGFAVSAGETVQRGDIIGYVGATGRATGYHVHYEVWATNRTLDPYRLLNLPVAATGD